MKAKFEHFNFNVLNLENSMNFYERTLGLKEACRKEGAGFTLVYLGDGISDFQLELTYMHDRTEPYDIGESEFHLAFVVDDFDESYRIHKELDCVCYENEAMGIYFIQDPDGYWLEIIPEKK